MLEAGGGQGRKIAEKADQGNARHPIKDGCYGARKDVIMENGRNRPKHKGAGAEAVPGPCFGAP